MSCCDLVVVWVRFAKGEKANGTFIVLYRYGGNFNKLRVPPEVVEGWMEYCRLPCTEEAKMRGLMLFS